MAAYCLVKARGRIDSKNIFTLKKVRPWYVFIPIALFAKTSKWKKFMNKVALLFPRSKSTYYQCYNCVMSGIAKRFRKIDCTNTDIIEFDNYEFSCFRGYDRLLKVMYGNYMQLPSNLHIHGITDGIDMSKY